MKCRVNLYDMGANRGPGALIGQIEDALDVGWSEWANEAGEAYFTLPYGHWAHAAIQPLNCHVEIQRQANLASAWVTVGWALVADHDSSRDDTVYYCDDYLSLFGSSITGLKTTYTNQPISDIISAEAALAICQTTPPTILPTSRLGFVVHGNIDATAATASILSDYQPRLELLRSLCQTVQGSSVAATAANITNGDFETGDLTGWTTGNVTGGNSVAVQAETRPTGAYDCLMHWAAGSAPWLFSGTHMAVSPGDYVAIDVRLRYPAYVGVNWFTSGDALISATHGLLSPSSVMAISSCTRGPAPATAAYGQLIVYPATLGDWLVVDDVHAYPLAVATRPIMSVSRSAPFTFTFYANKGQERPEIDLVYGTQVNGFRLRGGYGEVATDIYGVGQRAAGSAVMYSNQTGLPQTTYGIIQKAVYYVLLSDQDAMDKMVLAEAKKSAQLNRDLALVFRSTDGLAPYDGYAIGDSVPVTIQRGKTSLLRDYYTIWGLQWVGHRNGSEDTHLAVVPEIGGTAGSVWAPPPPATQRGGFRKWDLTPVTDPPVAPTGPPIVPVHPLQPEPGWPEPS